MLNDIRLTGGYVIAHQGRGEPAGFASILNGELLQFAGCGIHSGFPQLFCIHFAYTKPIISDRADYFFTPVCQTIYVPNVSKCVSIAFVLSDKGDSRYRGISASHEINFTLICFDMHTVVFSLPR